MGVQQGSKMAFTSCIQMLYLQAVGRTALQHDQTARLLGSSINLTSQHGHRLLAGLLSRRLQSSTSTVPSTSTRRKVGILTNLKQLSKFKLSSLVVLTSSAGFVLGSGEAIDWARLAWTSLGTLGAAACANTLNQIYEVANDRMMTRTCNRPLPAGRMTRVQALAFAVAAGTFGLGILHQQTNDLTTALGAANILLYAGIYTPLKQISIVNTWVGAVVGAIPPLMGWASAAGQLEPGAFVLGAALFFWQMPHFLALAWMCKDDYLRGGFRMISGVDMPGRRTALAALRNALWLLPLGYLAYTSGVTTQPFAWEAAALAAVLCVPAVKFAANPSQQTARKLFKSSLLYLPLLLIASVVHRQPNQHSITMADVRQRIDQQLEGSLETGLPQMLRIAGEHTVTAFTRVLGFSRAAVSELRCPSIVHSDEGNRSTPYHGTFMSTTTVVISSPNNRIGQPHQETDETHPPTYQSSSSATGKKLTMPDALISNDAVTGSPSRPDLVQSEGSRFWTDSSDVDKSRMSWRSGLIWLAHDLRPEDTKSAQHDALGSSGAKDC